MSKYPLANQGDIFPVASKPRRACATEIMYRDIRQASGLPNAIPPIMGGTAGPVAFLGRKDVFIVMGEGLNT